MFKAAHNNVAQPRLMHCMQLCSKIPSSKYPAPDALNAAVLQNIQRQHNSCCCLSRGNVSASMWKPQSTVALDVIMSNMRYVAYVEYNALY
jgi:hypothetical protein